MLGFAPLNYRTLYSALHLLWAPWPLALSTCELKIPSMLDLATLETDYWTIPAKLLIHALNLITTILADLATQHGIQSPIKNVPFATRTRSAGQNS